MGRIAYRPLGLRAIDVGRAEVVAEVGQDQRLEWFSLSPTGDALYTFGPRPGAPEIRGPSLVRRLDPLTFAITAEREVANPGSRGVVSLAATTGSRR